MRGRYNPCLYFHPRRNLRTFHHGNDFAAVGTRGGVRWLKDAFEKRFEIKSQCIGPGAVVNGNKVGAGASIGPAVTTVNGEYMK